MEKFWSFTKKEKHWDEHLTILQSRKIKKKKMIMPKNQKQMPLIRQVQPQQA